MNFVVVEIKLEWLEILKFGVFKRFSEGILITKTKCKLLSDKVVLRNGVDGHIYVFTLSTIFIVKHQKSFC